MKHHRHFLSVLLGLVFVVLSATGFSSCSDDNDSNNDPTQPTNIFFVGTWQMALFYRDGSVEVDEGLENRVTFFKDGTGKGWDADLEKETDFQWTYDEKEAILTAIGTYGGERQRTLDRVEIVSADMVKFTFSRQDAWDGHGWINGHWEDEGRYGEWEGLVRQ